MILMTNKSKAKASLWTLTINQYYFGSFDLLCLKYEIHHPNTISSTTCKCRYSPKLIYTVLSWGKFFAEYLYLNIAIYSKCQKYKIKGMHASVEKSNINTSKSPSLCLSLYISSQAFLIRSWSRCWIFRVFQSLFIYFSNGQFFVSHL